MHRFLVAPRSLVSRAARFWAVGVALSLAGVTGAAQAAVPLGGSPGGLEALAVSGGAAYAIVDSGTRARRSRSCAPTAPPRGRRGASAGATTSSRTSRADPATRSSPRGASSCSNGARFVVAERADRARGGVRRRAAARERHRAGAARARPRGAPLLAFPDDDGNTALGHGVAEERLTATAPEERHLPLDVAADAEGRAFVLDLVQTRTRSELRLLGPQAPAAPAVAVGALRDIRATLAIDQGRAYVAFALNGRAHLAIAALDSRRRVVEPAAAGPRRRLRGAGGAAARSEHVRRLHPAPAPRPRRRLPRHRRSRTRYASAASPAHGRRARAVRRRGRGRRALRRLVARQRAARARPSAVLDRLR